MHAPGHRADARFRAEAVGKAEARVAALGGEVCRVLPGGAHGLVLECRLGGEHCVLKWVPPGPAITREAAALRAWNGRGMVRLLAADVNEGWLLLAHLTGAPLSMIPAPAPIDACAQMCCALHAVSERPPEALTMPERVEQSLAWVAPRAAGWDAERRALLRAATPRLRALAERAGGEVLLHGDCLPKNIVVADDGRCTALDPFATWGPPAYDLATLALGFGASAPEHARALGRACGISVDETLAWVGALAPLFARPERGPAMLALARAYAAC